MPGQLLTSLQIRTQPDAADMTAALAAIFARGLPLTAVSSLNEVASGAVGSLLLTEHALMEPYKEQVRGVMNSTASSG